MQDMIDLTVMDADTGKRYGSLTEVMPTGANDVYQVTGEDKVNYLVPAIPDVIVDVDIDGGTLKIRPIRGSLTMRIDILTLFPEMWETVMAESIIGRARKRGAVQVCCHQIRNFAYDKHNRVDDTLFGGGMGMLMMAEPIALCMDDLVEQLGKSLMFSTCLPKGDFCPKRK